MALRRFRQDGKKTRKDGPLHRTGNCLRKIQVSIVLPDSGPWFKCMAVPLGPSMQGRKSRKTHLDRQTQKEQGSMRCDNLASTVVPKSKNLPSSCQLVTEFLPWRGKLPPTHVLAKGFTTWSQHVHTACGRFERTFGRYLAILGRCTGHRIERVPS